MIKTIMHRCNKKPELKGIGTRRFRRAIEAIMDKHQVDYEEALRILKAEGIKPLPGRVRGMHTPGGKYQPR